MTAERPSVEPRFGPDGLLPAIAQDASDGRVLMLAWMDAEALERTRSTGEAHFHSRSRDALWRKGETSGHTLQVRSVTLDCDADAILLAVDPGGPTCHRGTRSCFDPDHMRPPPDARGETVAGPGSQAKAGSGDGATGLGWLETLWATIEERAATRPAGSYTAELLSRGVDGVGRKVTEEATEVLIAAKDDAAAETDGADRGASRATLAGETADLLYHVLVLCAERGLPPSEVIGVLRARHEASRHEASRHEASDEAR